MQKSLKFLGLAIAVVGLFACLSNAATVTNRGEVITVDLMSENSGGGSTTVVKDQSVWPDETDRRGLYVITYSVPSAGLAAGAADIATWNVPKGTILLEDAVIEVSTAVLPDTSTNSIAVGGITVLATGTTLNTTGIKAAVATAGITTSDDEVTLTVTGDTATQGVFTVYLPVILGNAQ